MGFKELSQDEITTLLQTAELGTLSFAVDDNTYATPEGFGYDGKYIYFHFIYDKTSSKKREYMENTETVTFTVISEDKLESVIARGPLEKEEQEIKAVGTICENFTLPTFTFHTDKNLDELTTECYRLDPKELTGRRLLPDFPQD